MTNNTDAKNLSLIEKLGLDPNDYERSGQSWTPKGKFIPPFGNRVVFNAETAKLFMFREKEINVFKEIGGSALKTTKKSFLLYQLNESSFLAIRFTDSISSLSRPIRLASFRT